MSSTLQAPQATAPAMRGDGFSNGVIAVIATPFVVGGGAKAIYDAVTTHPAPQTFWATAGQSLTSRYAIPAIVTGLFFAARYFIGTSHGQRIFSRNNTLG